MLGYYTRRSFSDLLRPRLSRPPAPTAAIGAYFFANLDSDAVPRRILFAIRSKLGDTLISYQCARAYADAFPDSQVTLLTRRAYASLLRGETGLRVIGFDSRIEMACKLLWLRLWAPAFDILAVLWGSGSPIRLIGQMVKARRKIAWSRKFAPDIFEAGDLPPDPLLIEPAMSVIRVFEPRFTTPRSLSIPSLAARYRARIGNTAIGIAPIADEARRNFDCASLLLLIAEARRLHGAAPIRIFVNPGNAGSEALIAMSLPAGCELRPFRDLEALVGEYMALAAWVGTDTGLYHLAAAIGIPATVFFGPTQPHKIVMPAQTKTIAIRLDVLGDTHCEVKTCVRPLCLHAAVASWSHASPATGLDETPAACPLRGFPAGALGTIREINPA